MDNPFFRIATDMLVASKLDHTHIVVYTQAHVAIAQGDHTLSRKKIIRKTHIASTARLHSRAIHVSRQQF